MINPYPKVKETKKKKGQKGAAEAKLLRTNAKNLGNLPSLSTYVPLEHNAKFEYRPYEFGNYPLRDDGRPRGGTWRLSLPADADWSRRGENKEADASGKESGLEKKSPGKKKK